MHDYNGYPVQVNRFIDAVEIFHEIAAINS